MLPGVCPRRCTTSRVYSPTVRVSPCPTVRWTADGQVGGVGGVGHRHGSGRLDDVGQGPVVVPVAVRGDDGPQVGVADQRAERLRIGGRVDEQCIAARPCPRSR